MEATAQDNKKFNIKLPKFFKITFILFVAIILVLIFIMQLVIKSINVNVIDKEYNTVNIVLNKTEDEKIINFVNDYFTARNKLDFDNIYKSFNKNHATYKNTEQGKSYDNSILYEKKYVKSYDNIVVYDVDGINENEKVLFITYDMSFYFSKQSITSLITTYLVIDNDNIYFKDVFDIGETKYIDALMNNQEIKNMYHDIKTKLEKTLENDANLKLAYNSLRQYDINQYLNEVDDNIEDLNEEE